MKLNDQLLQRFINTFYGSGNYQGNYWFLGMEEGGGNDLNRVITRITAWQELGVTDLVDIYDFHMRINYPAYFTNPVKLQRTWIQQARIVLAAKGKPSKAADVKIYQRDIIGRKDSQTCLLELLPLPSPSTSDWFYNRWTDIDFLRTRESYRNYCLPWRITNIQSRIQQYQPKLVIFCGKSYSEYWHKIAGRHLIFQDQGDFQAAKSEGILYLIIKHPATIGITNAYFERVGEFVRINQ